MSDSRRHRFGEPEPDAFERIRQAITAIDHERRAAASNAGAALVNQAEVERALREQMTQLTKARRQIGVALAAAEHAAAGARADDGDRAAVPYDVTADGLRSALQVVDASFEQLDGLHEVSQSNIQRARDLLVHARRTLDAALRDQVTLLVRLEQVHRRALVEQARQDRDDHRRRSAEGQNERPRTAGSG